MSSPPGSDALLLRAVLDRDDGLAVDAARRWLDLVDVQTIGYDQSRLLPMLYRRLDRLGVDGLPPILRGTYRRAWVHNQLRFREVAKVLGELDAAGIDALLLKGASLLVSYDGDWGARSSADVDVLVPRAHVHRAIDLLAAGGWRPEPGGSPEALRARQLHRRHSWPFNAGTGLDLDLHWHAFAGSLGRGADASFFEHAVPVELHGTTTKRMGDADLLLHLIEHASRASEESRLQWVVDATVVLRRAEDLEALGERLVRQARDHDLLDVARSALEGVAATTGDAEPATLAMRLAAPSARRRATWRRRFPVWSRHGGGRTGLVGTTLGWAGEVLDAPLGAPRWRWAARVASGGRLRAASTTPEPLAPQPLDQLGDLDLTLPSTLDRHGGPGWSYAEPDGTWTEGREARLHFVAPGRPVRLVLEVHPLPAAVGSTRRLAVEVDGRVVAALVVDDVAAWHDLVVPVPAGPTGTAVQVGLVVHPIGVPARLGLNDDTRRLGALVRRVRIEPHEPATP